MKIDSDKLIARLILMKRGQKALNFLFGQNQKRKATVETINKVIKKIQELVEEEERKSNLMTFQKVCGDRTEYFTVETNLFDEEQTYSNCIVQLLHNTVTDEYSVGWWDNKGV